MLLLNSVMAQQLLVPEFTPESVTDFTVSYMMYDQLLRDMRALGMEPIDGDTLRQTHGDVGDDCAINRDCVAALFELYPDAPLVVVGEVGTTNEGLTVEVHYYVRDDPQAVKTRKQVLEPGAELQHTEAIARQAADLLAIVTMFQPLEPPEKPIEPDEPPQPQDPDDPFDEDPVDGDPVEVDPFDEDPEIYEPIVEDPLFPDERDPIEERPDRPPEKPVVRLDDKAERRKMGVSKKNYQRYVDSGMERQAWMEENRVRTGTFNLELGGGYATGSLDRQYDVILVLEEGANGNFVEQERFEQDVLIAGVGGHGSAGVSVGINANLELGLLASLQFAHKHHMKGWEHQEQGELLDEFRLEYDPVAALVAVIEPRIRVYALQRGPVKPYVLGLGQLRIYDGYVVEDTSQVNYPDRPPLYPFGLGAGGGLMLDLSPGFSLFIEVPVSRMLWGFEGIQRDAPSLKNPPAAAEENLDTMRVYAGLGLKF